MVNGLCAMDLPSEAKNLMEETRGLGLKPSVFEFRRLRSDSMQMPPKRLPEAFLLEEEEATGCLIGNCKGCLIGDCDSWVAIDARTVGWKPCETATRMEMQRRIAMEGGCGGLWQWRWS
ncbi:hypothetical protein F0562_019161 [Nyssa sinensis]|uniref:Uncharacterized protein n=1 Tax=Nyssa sinensis TaxID=561372 RepID=A0A5J4ZE65_9ASTE|nr:hypothetical protein F0562_019161 [Nyssa sinensis]